MLPRRVYFRGGEEEEAGGGSPNWASGQGVGANYLSRHRIVVSRERARRIWRPRAAIIIATRAIPRFIDQS